MNKKKPRTKMARPKPAKKTKIKFRRTRHTSSVEPVEVVIPKKPGEWVQIRIGNLRQLHVSPAVLWPPGYDFRYLLKLPPKAQAFRLLQRLRDNSRCQITQLQPDAEKLRDQLLATQAPIEAAQTNIEVAKDWLAVLSQDHRTDFRQMNYERLKATRRPGQAYYATSDCWMCGNVMPLEDFQPHRFFCSNTCAQEAKRRRNKLRVQKPAKPRCPWCDQPLPKRRRRWGRTLGPTTRTSKSTTKADRTDFDDFFVAH